MIGRRFFLGRAAVGAAAGPALVRQVEGALLDEKMPCVRTDHGRFDEPEEVAEVTDSPSKIKDPILKLLHAQLQDQYRINDRKRRIQTRRILAMRSWSPCFIEMQMDEATKKDDSAIKELWKKIEEAGGN